MANTSCVSGIRITGRSGSTTSPRDSDASASSMSGMHSPMGRSAVTSD